MRRNYGRSLAQRLLNFLSRAGIELSDDRSDRSDLTKYGSIEIFPPLRLIVPASEDVTLSVHYDSAFQDKNVTINRLHTLKDGLDISLSTRAGEYDYMIFKNRNRLNAELALRNRGYQFIYDHKKRVFTPASSQHERSQYPFLSG